MKTGPIFWCVFGLCWGWVGVGDVNVRVHLQSQWMLRCALQEVDATLLVWGWGGLGWVMLTLVCTCRTSGCYENDCTKMRSERRRQITQMLCMESSPSGRMDFTWNGNEDTGFY